MFIKDINTLKKYGKKLERKTVQQIILEIMHQCSPQSSWKDVMRAAGSISALCTASSIDAYTREQIENGKYDIVDIALLETKPEGK